MAIRYRYAKAPNGDYVDIKDVNEENRRNMKFVCISCGCDMVASLGDKTHHFRHKQELFCNKETYLHKLGKYTFVKTYKECIELRKPYYITLQRRIPCSLESTCAIKANNEKVSCLSFEKQKWDLTQYYQTIIEEKRVDDFIPDVLLKSDQDISPIFIEIKVTHPCTEEKIRKGYPIIELAIKDESDLDIIKSCNLVESLERESGIFFSDSNDKQLKIEETIKFYNFKDKRYTPLYLTKLPRFYVKRDCLTDFCSNNDYYCCELEEKKVINRNNNAYLYEIYFHEPLDIQKCILFGLAKAYERGIKVRNCYLCKHYETNQFRYGLNKDKPIFCRVLYNLDDNGYCKASKAKECSGYEPDKTVYEQYLTYAHHYEEVMH